MLNGVLGSNLWDRQWVYWFLETVTWATLAALALVAIPPVHRAMRRWPFGAACVALGAALLLRYGYDEPEPWYLEPYTLPGTLWLVALGWVIAAAPTFRHRLLVSAVLPVLFVGFLSGWTHPTVIVTGILALIWVPSILSLIHI